MEKEVGGVGGRVAKKVGEGGWGEGGRGSRVQRGRGWNTPAFILLPFGGGEDFELGLIRIILLRFFRVRVGLLRILRSCCEATVFGNVGPELLEFRESLWEFGH